MPWPFSRAKAPASGSGGGYGLFLASATSRQVRRSAGELLVAYHTSPWLRRVVHRVAHSTAAAEWMAYRATRAARRELAQAKHVPTEYRKAWRALKQAGDVTPLDSHPMLDVIERGNDAFDGTMVRALATMQVDLAGEGFLLPELDGGGRPLQLWVIPPTWVREAPVVGDPNGAFRLRMPGGAAEIPVPQRDLVWMRDLSPADPYGRGTGFAGSLDDELDADQQAASHVRAFFTNHAVPPLLISADGADATERDRVAEWWRQRAQGLARRWMPLFLNRKLDVKELSSKFADMELVELRRFAGEIVQQVYGVPPEILANVNESKRATIDAADYLFAKHVVVPRLDRLRGAYQRLADRYNDGVVIDYVSPVEEDREYALSVMRAAPWAFTVDEWREAAGREPMEGEPGAARFASAKVQAIGGGDEPEPAAEPEEEADPETTPEPEEGGGEKAQRARAAVAALSAEPVAAALRAFGAAPRIVRRVNLRTRVAIRAAVLAGDGAEARVARVFEEARGARARGIARTVAPDRQVELRVALRSAFDTQERAVLAALSDTAAAAA